MAYLTAFHVSYRCCVSALIALKISTTHMFTYYHFSPDGTHLESQVFYGFYHSNQLQVRLFVFCRCSFCYSKNFPSLRNPKVSYLVKGPALRNYCDPGNPVYTTTPNFFETYFNIMVWSKLMWVYCQMYLRVSCLGLLDAIAPIFFVEGYRFWSCWT